MQAQTMIPATSDIVTFTHESHVAHGHDFCKWWAYFSMYGVAIRDDDFILMAGEDVVNGDPDAWLVWWLASKKPGGMLRAIRYMSVYRPKITWCRSLSGSMELRYYSTDRFTALIKGK